MNKKNVLTTKLFILSFLLLLGLSQQMSGQKKEARKFFPIDDNTAFIDRAGRVVISSKQHELIEEARRVSTNLGGIRGLHQESTWIRLGEFSEGLAIVGWALCPACRNPFWVNGIIDETGKMIIPPKTSHTRYGSFHEGLAQHFDRGWGFIDRAGREVIPAKYYEASNFSEGLAFVRLTEKGKYGYINQKGELAITFQFDWASSFHEGLAAVRLSKGKYGFIDKTGKVILHSKKWLDVNDFSEGLASVEIEVADNSVYRGYKDLKRGFIDRQGRFVISPRLDRVQNFSEGRALFFQTGKNHGYGFIDANGQAVIEPEYVDGKKFSEGLAAVAVKSSDDKKLWGYINHEGKWVIQPQFQNVNSFDGGLAGVNCDEYGRDCKAYIDLQGKAVC